MTSDEQPFLEALRLDPDDDTQRLIYADWLEEQGDGRAEYLRLEMEFAALPIRARQRWPQRRRFLDLHRQQNPDWLVRVARGKIENCEPAFQPICPRLWQNLERLDEPMERHCPACRQKVSYCSTVIDAARRQHHDGRFVLDITRPRFRNDLRSPQQ